MDRSPLPRVEVPQRFTRSGSARVPDTWWTAFGDPALDKLVSKALASNLDIKAAFARLRQARAMVTQARAPLFPQVTFQGQAQRRRTIFFIGGPIGNPSSTFNLYDLNLTASYEVDAWGKAVSALDAARMQEKAAREELQALSMTLSAQVAEAYFALVETRAEMALLRRQTGVSEHHLELVEDRYDAGLASALDVYQQRQQLEALKGVRPELEQNRRLLENQLSVLLGEPPGNSSFAVAEHLPRLPPLPATGVPADLLQKRPDVRAARDRAVAADHRVATAIADWLPGLRIQASIGTIGASPSDLFRDFVYSILGAVSATLFDGLYHKAQVDQARAERDEALFTYTRTLLVAIREVEDALATEKGLTGQLAALNSQLEAVKKTLDSAWERYAYGLADYMVVLQALSRMQELERSLLRTQKAVLSARASLYRAIGGSVPLDRVARGKSGQAGERVEE